MHSEYKNQYALIDSTNTVFQVIMADSEYDAVSELKAVFDIKTAVSMEEKGLAWVGLKWDPESDSFEYPEGSVPQNTSVNIPSETL